MNANLPPGCSLADIDLATGVLVHCADCERLVEVTGNESEDEPIVCAKCASQDDDYERWRDEQMDNKP